MRPRMKGDTLEFNTENMIMRHNSVVEELLRRLPGLQIDADGTITYNGEKIQHLLVDGEDIFGSDPTMVTRNFDAGKIARVQILDRKSDQAVFTGIDDGTRTKTLNLVLKESAKDGYFGKVEAGGDAQGYYNANGALAAFRDKEQFTALGLASNTGILGFSNGSGNSSSSVSFLNGNSDALGASAGTGIPKFAAAALHYANTWNGPEDHLVANYQYSHFFTQPVTVTQSLQTQPDSVYGQFQQSQSVNQQVQHWVYGIYDWAPTTRSGFKFIFHGSNSQGQNQYSSSGNGTFNDTLVNSSQRSIQDKVSRQNLGGNIAWRTQIGMHPENIFSVNLGLTKIDNVTNGYLYSVNRFFQPNGIIQSVDTVDQRKQIANHPLELGGTVNYTSRLWKGAVVGLSYGFHFSGDKPIQATFDRGDGKYQQTVDTLTSNLNTRTTNQIVTINLQGKTRHLSYTIGNNMIAYGYWQKDMLTDSMLRLHYLNLAPRILLNYTPNPATNVNFNYNASTQEPSVAQLQPVKNNNDPLHITLGNPNLKPGFTQAFQLNIHRFKTWIINLGINLNLSNNSISTKTMTDSFGRQISQPVNVDGGRTAGMNVSVNRKVFGFDAGLSGAISYSRTVNYVNADLNRNDVYTGGGGFSLNKYDADKYSLQLSTNFTYFDQVSSINPSAPVRYWTNYDQGSVTLFFIKGFELNTSAVYTWQEKTSTFTGNTSVLLWNAYVSRNFLHDKLVAKFQFNNILDANAGISRTNVANVNTETSTNILGRYWMLSAVYHFDKKFKRK